ncbi:hypothetical protein D3C75_752300 [compost metagenome]
MRIIINDQNIIDLPKHLKPPFCTMEFQDGLRNCLERNSGFHTGNHCRHGVVQIVFSGNGQLDAPQHLTAEVHGVDYLPVAKHNISCRVIRRR